MGSLFSSKPQTQTQTTVQNQSSSSATTPNAANQVQSFLANQLNVASQPYQGTTQPIAGFSPLQQQAFGLGQSNVGAYQPYLAGAQSALASGTTPAYASVDQYMSPYINDVVNATQNQFALQNAQQLQQVRGNAAAQGALGGDREGVAEALAAQAQNMAQAPVIAGLYNTGYQNALNTAGADASRQLQAAGLYGTLGGQAQQYGQSDINSLYNLGAQQQANEQANLTSQWQNSQNALAYPFQTGQYYAGLLGSLGGLEGSTSTGSSSGTGTGTGTVTPAQPSLGAQLLGAGLSAASLFAPVPYTTAANGGRIGYASGGLAVPYGGTGYVPATALAPAQVPTSPLPSAPAPMQMSTPSNVARPTGASDLVKEALGIASQLRQNGIRTPPSDDGALGRVAERFGVAQPSSTSPAAPSGASSAPGSWYSQYRGSNYDWVDPSDKPGSNALGVPDSSQGIALPSRSTLGKWFNVTAPNGQTLRLQQTDIGPAGWTGRGIDIAASAADRFGYSPKSFPTGGSFTWVPAEARGGRIGFADGGTPSFDEMWQDRIAPQDAEGPPMPQGLGTQVADASERAPWPDASAAPPPPAPPPPDLGGGSPDELNPRGGIAPAGPSAPSASSAPSGLSLSPDLRMALLAAGSKLMSTPGPIGVALGEGLGAGVSTYAAAQKLREQLAQRTAQQQELAAHHRALESAASERLAAMKDRAQGVWSPTIDRSGNVRYFNNRTFEWRDSPLGTTQAAQSAPGAPPSTTPNTSSVPAPAKTASLDLTASLAPMTLNGSAKNLTTQLAEVSNNAPEPPKYNEEALKSLTPSEQQDVKNLVKYDLLPGQITRGRSKEAEGRYRRLMDAAALYDPSYQPAKAGNIQRAIYEWDSGKHGDTVRRFSTAIDHLDLLAQLSTALDNGDSQGLNRLRNAFRAQFGSELPTNFDAAKQVVGNEVIGAIVAGTNALGDREEIAANINRNGSRGQQAGVIRVYEALMGGQFHNLERQYVQATKQHDFAERLSPRAREVFYGRVGAPTGATAPSSAPSRAPSSRPTATGKNGEKYILSEDRKSWWRTK